MLREFSTSAYSLTDVLRIRQQTLDYELKIIESNIGLVTAVALIRRLSASAYIQ
jgi:hypothetical protein